MRPGIDRPACAAIAVAAALLAGGDAAAQATEPSSPAGLYGSLSGLYVWAPESSWAARYESGIANRGDYGWESGSGAVAALGYDTGTGWRVEAELGWRSLDLDRIRLAGARWMKFAGEAEARTLSAMANVYWAVPGGWMLQPYLGAGIGAARQDWRSGGSIDDTMFAWQAMAGVRHALSDRAELHVGYRFFSTADWQLGGRDADGDAWRSEVDYRTHNLEGGVTFRF